MKAEINDQMGIKFKILLAASIGILLAVIALGETGII
jgi:hypothetical protein